jgi:hypothetical protein
LIGDLRPGLRVAVTGPAGAGKSTLLLTTAVAAARGGWSTLLITRDLPLTEVSIRLTAIVSGVPIDVLRSGALAEKQWRAVTTAFAQHRPLVVVDQSSGPLRTWASYVSDGVPRPDLVIVDGDGQHEPPQEETNAGGAEREPRPAVIVSSCTQQQPAQIPAELANADVHVELHSRPPRTVDARTIEVRAVVCRNRYGPCGTVTLMLRLDRAMFATAALPADTAS